MHASLRSKQILRVAVVLLLGLGLGACGSGSGETEEQSGSQSAALLVDMSNFRYDGLNGGPTQCTPFGETTSLHCCQYGEAMIGIRPDQNVFKCAALNPDERTGSRFLDKYTYVNGFHVCPSGAVMVGYHQTNDWLYCQTLPRAATTTWYDPATAGGFTTQDGYMHVCSTNINAAMSGINASASRFFCRSDYTVGHG